MPHNGREGYRELCSDGVWRGGQVLMIWLLTQYRRLIAALGRRAGKTTCWDFAIPVLQSRKAGVFHSAFIAQDHAKAKEKFEKFLSAMGGDPAIHPNSLVRSFHRSEGQDRWVELKAIHDEHSGRNQNTGGRHYFWSGAHPHYERIQGFQNPFDIIGIDEPQLQHSRMVEQIVMPMLMDTDGILWCFGHPDYNGAGNEWYEAFYDRGTSEVWRSQGWYSVKFPSESNPVVALKNFQQMRNEYINDDVRKQEMDAEFVRDKGGVFQRVTEVCSLEPMEYEPDWLVNARARIPVANLTAWVYRNPTPLTPYALSVDWAKDSDATVITIFDLTSLEQVALFHFWGDELEPKIQWVDFLHEHYNGATIDSDENGIGASMTERLRRKYLDAVTGHKWQLRGGQAKAAYVGRLGLLFANLEIRLINCEEQKAELRKYRKVVSTSADGTPTGHILYTHPPHGHDDMVDVLLMLSEKLSLGKQRHARAPTLPPRPGTLDWLRAARKKRRLNALIRRGQI